MSESSTKVRTRRPLLKRPAIRVALGVVVFFVAVALYLLQPWKLWIDEVVNEPAPGGNAQPVELARGELIRHEHETTGTVRVLQLADGSRVLRLENLDTTNGPVLKVVLSDAKVVSEKDGWHVFDDGKYIDLGRLKGNKGSQNYTLPRDADLDDYRSVSIWCDRFNVSFGAATLTGG